MGACRRVQLVKIPKGSSETSGRRLLRWVVRSIAGPSREPDQIDCQIKSTAEPNRLPDQIDCQVQRRMLFDRTNGPLFWGKYFKIAQLESTTSSLHNPDWSSLTGYDLKPA